ncbi:MAG: SRPBCC family protein [Anaerolineales bacterium]|nr:SRPBCC family protein [Anaerolineales bacterium]
MNTSTLRAIILYPLTFLLFVGGILAFPALLLLRPFHRNWGATPDEATQPLPGDAELKTAIYQATRAVTINAPPQEVWPWIAQMGYHRAGWYGFDQFDNDGIPSATRVRPELQHPNVGDVIGEEGLTIRAIDPARGLILSFFHPKTTWVFKEGIWPKFGASSLVYILRPLHSRHTRLIVRMRFQAKSPSLPILWWPFFEVGDFLNARKQLLGIRQRVESPAAYNSRS